MRLETRNIRPRVSLSDIIVAVGGQLLPSEDITLDDTGNIGLNIRDPAVPVDELDVVIIVRELCEPLSGTGQARRLGLPLFSVAFVNTLNEHPQSFRRAQVQVSAGVKSW